MKKTIPIAMLVAGLVLGVVLHVPILSVLDDTREIKGFEDAPAPSGFAITPAEASFIVVNLKQGYHWGMIQADAVFTDSENYYVISPKESAYRPDTFIRWSYLARLHGYCVSGKDGRIRRSSDRENVGFLLISLDELRAKFPAGTPRDQVTDSIGWGYDVRSQSSQEWHVYFLQKEGECVVGFEDEKLKSVEKANWMRI